MWIPCPRPPARPLTAPGAPPSQLLTIHHRENREGGSKEIKHKAEFHPGGLPVVNTAAGSGAQKQTGSQGGVSTKEPPRNPCSRDLDDGVASREVSNDFHATHVRHPSSQDPLWDHLLGIGTNLLPTTTRTSRRPRPAVSAILAPAHNRPLGAIPFTKSPSMTNRRVTRSVTPELWKVEGMLVKCAIELVPQVGRGYYSTSWF